MGRRGEGRRRSAPTEVLAAVLVVVAAAAACSGSGSDSSSGSATTAPASSTSEATTSEAPTTTEPATWAATVVGEHEINPGIRQGLARAGDGFVLSTNNGMYRVDADYVATSPPGDRAEPAIPADLAAQGYDHVGDIDIDIDGEVLWAPLERPDKESGEQVLARYDAETLEFLDSVVVPQHHASFVAVGPDGTIYSTDEFSDDTLVRYRFEDGALETLAPLAMDRTIERIQGADIAAGAAWLATDDERNGLYRVDLTTGEVQDVGSMGYPEGEGEGIDAQEGEDGQVLLFALCADPALIPMRVIELTAAPG
jgi:hypothetical protein